MVITPHIPTVPFKGRRAGYNPEFYDTVCETHGSTTVCSNVLNQKGMDHQQSFEGMWLVFALIMIGGIVCGFLVGRWMMR